MRKVIVALAVVGVAVSAFALNGHYSAAAEPYGTHGWNCALVNHSGFSTFGPIPVAAIGVAGYLLLAVLSWFRRRGWTLLFSWIGLGFASYLSYVEAYVLQTWCATCVVSQCLISLIAILALIDIIITLTRSIMGKASGAVDQVVTHLRYG